MKAKILIEDGSRRWEKGDVGDILENDFEKYDYRLYLGDAWTFLFGKRTRFRKIYYFYSNEIELLTP